MNAQPSRSLETIVTGQPTSDGAGVKLTRVLTQPLQRRLDPFLMLDNFASDDPDDYLAGFPDHPHRGFETITYMIDGRMRHRDSAGNEGLLQPGGMQWMTTGRGLVHSEMPEQAAGVMEGFQLWLNLPARDKLCAPWYRDFDSSEIPEYTTPGGVRVRVLAGHSQGTDGAVRRSAQTHPTDVLYLDLHFPDQGAVFEQALPQSCNAFVYTYRGTLNILAPHHEPAAVPRHRMGIFANDGDHICLRADGTARALLIAGSPLGEPIAQYGPFVMNTRDELMAAVDDYRHGRLG